MSSIVRNFSVMLFLSLIWCTTMNAQFKPGETYFGFKLIEKRFVKEVNADCYYFEHTKSGARLFKIAAADNNKTFCISFKTVPESDGGTPHILEHSVLNGSKNYPVKSPFDLLMKGSLNTFLNAFTSSDATMYPVASMNDKDYFNLMHIYLDAVFNPLIYSDPRIFYQEGWHREVDSIGNVTYKGVVYNEMKGAFSSAPRELAYQVQRNLFPDNGYRFSSGGYPAAIPTLTYDSFINFHKKYYHPSNSHILLYGDANLSKELELIDKEYLSGYTNLGFRANIPLQKPFKKMKEYQGYYSISEGEKTDNQTYLSLTFVTDLNTNREHTMALDILADVLVNQEAAPIRLALKEAKIGTDVSAFSNEQQQCTFQIRVQNANAGDKDRFIQIVMKVLNEAAVKGLDKRAAAGTMNRIEFRLREGNDAQKGLTYNGQIITWWFFNNDPFIGLEYEKLLTNIKTEIEKGLLEKTIKQYFLSNPHSLLLVLEPKPGFEKENLEKINAELKAYKDALSVEQLDKLAKESIELIKYQKTEDKPEALATIPLLDKSEINPKSAWYSINEEKLAGTQLLTYDDFTNDVVYSKLMFDMRTLPIEQVPYAALLSEVLGSLDTKQYSYGELDKEISLQTGGFRTSIVLFSPGKKDDNLLPKFTIDSKAMNVKTVKLFELLTEIINSSKINDPDRLKTILTRYQTRLENQTKQNGNVFAQVRLNSYFTKSGLFTEMISGFEYYWFISKLMKNFDAQKEDIIANLSKVAELLFKKGNLLSSVTCNSKDLPAYKSELEKFINTLPASSSDILTWDLKPEIKNEGFLTTSKVQYVLKGFDYKKLGYNWSGKLMVLQNVLSREWLQNQIRVIGGAYGSGAVFAPIGIMNFSSYRDPNLKETIENFDNTTNYLDSFSADEKAMTRFIIGTIARIDRPMTATDKGNTAVRRFLEKVDAKVIQQERDEILSTTANDIKSFKKMVKDILSQNVICVYGSEEKIKAQQFLFKTVLKIKQ